MVEYQYEKIGADARCLHDEVLADPAVVTELTHVTVDGTIAKVAFIASISAAEKTALDSIISVHDGCSLSVLQENRRQEVSANTQALVSAGFVFDSQTFDLAHMARTTWIGMYSLRHLLTWPKNIGTMTGEEYSLSEANIEAFMGTALGAYDYILSGERTLKHSINIATTKAELDAVVDER